MTKGQAEEMTAAAAIDPEALEKTEREWSVAAVAKRNKAMALKVVDVESQGEAAAYVEEFASALKKVEAKRRSWVDPLNGIVKRINAGFKRISEPLEEGSRHVRGELVAYQTRLEDEARRKREEAERKAAAEQKKLDKKAEKKGELAPTVEPAYVPAPARTVGAVGMKKVWTFEVEDPLKVPRQFLVVDELAIRKALREAVKEAKEGEAPALEIPGVRIFQENQVSL